MHAFSRKLRHCRSPRCACLKVFGKGQPARIQRPQWPDRLWPLGDGKEHALKQLGRTDELMIRQRYPGQDRIPEQEYRDVDGLLREYPRRPLHWTCADNRWFEYEVPTPIVLLALAHVYRWADGPVLPAAEGSMSEASSFASADCAVADVYGPTATSDATSADASPGVSVTGGSTRRASIR